MAKITNTGVFIAEGSAAAADVAGSSQIWVKSDTPSSLYHTDDAGTDFRINGITVSAEQSPTSGTSVDFTGIPSGVRNIKIFNEMLELEEMDEEEFLDVQQKMAPNNVDSDPETDALEQKMNDSLENMEKDTPQGFMPLPEKGVK